MTIEDIQAFLIWHIAKRGSLTYRDIARLEQLIAEWREQCENQT